MDRREIKKQTIMERVVSPRRGVQALRVRGKLSDALPETQARYRAIAKRIKVPGSRSPFDPDPAIPYGDALAAGLELLDHYIAKHGKPPTGAMCPTLQDVGAYILSDGKPMVTKAHDRLADAAYAQAEKVAPDVRRALALRCVTLVHEADGGAGFVAGERVKAKGAVFTKAFCKVKAKEVYDVEAPYSRRAGIITAVADLVVDGKKRGQVVEIAGKWSHACDWAPAGG